MERSKELLQETMQELNQQELESITGGYNNAAKGRGFTLTGKVCSWGNMFTVSPYKPQGTCTRFY